MGHSFELKLTKTIGIPEMLETGHDYIIAGKMSVTDINKHDEDNGNFLYTHKGQLIQLEFINKAGLTIKGKAKGSQSQKLRWSIMEKENTEEYYQKVMSALIENIDDVISYLHI